MLRVDCREGDPVTLWFGTRRADVLAVTDRWFGCDQRWWKVITREGDYIVRLDEATRTWDLAAVVGA